jgi:uncharacterized protein GlcG (DUF336 family)
MSLTLALAHKILANALEHGRAKAMRPLTVVVLDARAAVIAVASEDGSSLDRFTIARAKARGALAFNLGSRAVEKIATDRPHFFAGVAPMIEGGIVPVAGGVLIRSADKAVIGAIGISGDNSDNDEAAGLVGIAAAGLIGDGG